MVPQTLTRQDQNRRKDQDFSAFLGLSQVGKYQNLAFLSFVHLSPKTLQKSKTLYGYG
jgi:hypothetical protein